jgi:hypothetical protein
VLKASKNCLTELTPSICSCTLLTDLIICENQLNVHFLPFLVNNVWHFLHPGTAGQPRQFAPSALPGRECEQFARRSLNHRRMPGVEHPHSAAQPAQRTAHGAGEAECERMHKYYFYSCGVTLLFVLNLVNVLNLMNFFQNLQVLDVVDNNLKYLPYTLTVLYQAKTLSALWLSFNQPPLPKLSTTHEPVMNIKVGTGLE